MGDSKDIRVALHDYEIVLSDGLDALATWLQTSGHSTYFLLTDRNTSALCKPLLDSHSSMPAMTEICVPAGERHKVLHTCEDIWEQLLSKTADRKALMINLGGGVIGDMGGFAASCYKRGIDFMQVPTTVLAQVDASIGGKLGVDFKFGKNLIGLFRNPRHIHISTAFHASLPDREYVNGFAEVFKHALIGSGEQWEYYREVLDLREAGTIERLHESLMIKKRIVEADPREQGIRKALNFGHTIGHAVEADSLERSDDPLLHGEAMAVGMIMEGYLSHEKLGLPESVLEEIAQVMHRHYPPYRLETVDPEVLWQYMTMDKKNEGNRVMSALIKAVGEPVINVELTRNDLRKAVGYYNSLPV